MAKRNVNQLKDAEKYAVIRILAQNDGKEFESVESLLKYLQVKTQVTVTRYNLQAMLRNAGIKIKFRHEDEVKKKSPMATLFKRVDSLTEEVEELKRRVDTITNLLK